MTTPLSAEILAALDQIGSPVTNRDLTRLLNRQRNPALTREAVYGALASLRYRGRVLALPSPTNKRIRYWQLSEVANTEHSRPCRHRPEQDQL